MLKKPLTKSILSGILASGILLEIYFAALSLISGWNFAQVQFASYWYFIVSLAVGFGIQAALYVYLKNFIHLANLERRVPSGKNNGRVLGVTGTTSTIAMVSCCAHYLANILPIIGASGALALIGQYQIEFFWLGLVANAAGIAFMSNKIIKLRREFK